MDLIQLLVLLLVIGVVIYLVQNFLPIDNRIKMLIIGILILIVIIWLLNAVGLIGHFYLGPHR